MQGISAGTGEEKKYLASHERREKKTSENIINFNDTTATFSTQVRFFVLFRVLEWKVLIMPKVAPILTLYHFNSICLHSSHVTLAPGV